MDNKMDDKKHITCYLILAATLLNTVIVNTAQAGPFNRDSTDVSLVLGTGSAFNNNYIILGGGIGYYVRDGLEVGVDIQRWSSASPSLIKVSTQLKYVFLSMSQLQPYLGVFFRRTFVNSSQFINQNSYGLRTGVYFPNQSGVYLGMGVAYENYQHCDAGDCSVFYPELLISFSL